MTLDFKDSRELIQKLKDPPRIRYSHIATLTAGICIGFTLLATVRSCETELPPQTDCGKCHNRQMAMTQYFRRSGNKTPEMMAVAVLATKSPRLMAAIAVKGEKNTPYTVRRGGYKRQHAGAWQMNERIHGKQPLDAVGQALSAERYVTELFNELPPKLALNQFGGERDLVNGDYALPILAEMRNVP